MKRKSQPESAEPQKFSVGETVVVIRPHLWSGVSGEVVSFKDGLHRIKVKCTGATTDFGKVPITHFHVDVPGSLLEGFI